MRLSGGALGSPEAAVRVFTLFLEQDTLEEYRSLVQRLADEFDTENPTDTVMAALRAQATAMFPDEP